MLIKMVPTFSKYVEFILQKNPAVQKSACN